MVKRAFTIAAVILVLFALLNFEHAVRIGAYIGKALYPVFIGILVALVLNAPVTLLEKTLLASPKLKKARRALSLTITLTVILGIAALAGFLIVPEVINSVQSILDRLPKLQENGWESFFGTRLPGFITNNLENILQEFTERLENTLPRALEALKSTLKSFTDVLIGLFMGILIIASKERLVEGVRKLILYFRGKEKTIKAMASLGMATEKFSLFLAGQLLEALIFGVMCFITFIIFKIPYAALATIIMAVSNLIPMLGGYIGGAISFIFIFSASPPKALVFIIVIIVLQQIEQLTTYPVVVGRYVGLSSFWMLFSVVVGGGLLGFWGLVLGVPIVAFFHHFFKVMYDIKMNKGDKALNIPET